IVFLSFCALNLFYGLVWRFIVYMALDTRAFAGLLSQRVILAATAERLPALVEAAGDSTIAGRLEVTALASEGPEDSEAAVEIEPLLTESVSFDQVPGLAEENCVDLVLLDPEGVAPGRWLALAEDLAAVGVPVRLISGHEPDIGLGLDAGEPGSAGKQELLVKPISGFDALAKRTVDIAVSFFVLVLASPLMFFIALAIRVSSRGSVIYRQERVGRNGVVFNLLKFRSMVPEAERHTGPVWSSRDDDRVIPGIGRFIRRNGLDELPQFWNVLTGGMSLVGPRPERAYFFDQYPELYRGRLAVRPGLTGLAQVSCRHTTSVNRKVRHDLYYIRNYSLALDSEILWRTLVMLLKEEWRLVFGKDDSRERKGMKASGKVAKVQSGKGKSKAQSS
ncbi:MAG: sugar transferase, partial [Gemmatimonadota bacterium]|nr:sugar transferase [Gemmatimonadota bacterium]